VEATLRRRSVVDENGLARLQNAAEEFLASWIAAGAGVKRRDSATHSAAVDAEDADQLTAVAVDAFRSRVAGLAGRGYDANGVHLEGGSEKENLLSCSGEAATAATTVVRT